MTKEFIKLTPDLITEIPVIDKQHELFINKVNDFLVSTVSNGKIPQGEKMLKDFYDYTKGHFATEERFMRKYKFTGLENHWNEHRVYVSKVEKLMIMFEKTGNTPEFIRKIQMEVIDWFKNHILTYDIKMAEFLKGRSEDGEFEE